MNTKRIKEICERSDSYGMSESEYKIHDKYTTMLWEAWEEWSDEITKKYWENDEKPEKPTYSFREQYFNSFDFDELL